MSPASCGVLDTTVFIAGKNGRSLDETGLTEEGVISGSYGVLPIDEAAAMKWAQLRVHLAESGRKINVNDLWIAATAAAHGA